jgi:hypothetical protein
LFEIEWTFNVNKARPYSSTTPFTYLKLQFELPLCGLLE